MDHLAATLGAQGQRCRRRHGEDLAQPQTETARLTLSELGIHEGDVLARIHQSLLADGAVVSAAEAGWVAGRLAELLD